MIESRRAKTVFGRGGVSNVLLAGSLALAAALPLMAGAQGALTKPIRVVVPFATGGNTDAVARLLTAKISEQVGQPGVVENKAGANGIVGSEFVAKSPADGSTFLIVTPSHAINPLVTLKLPYDTLRDFTPISLISRTPFVVAVTNELPVANMRELIAYAKANPTKLSYASSGIGTGAHLTTELFKMAAGVQMLHVTYKGTGPALPDLISGRVSLIFDVEQVLMPQIRAGKLRGFAITSGSRSPTAQEVPTMQEAGINLVTASWVGMLAPGGLPADLATRMANEVRRALNTPDMKEKMIGFGAEIVGSTPAEFDAYIRSENTKWGDVAKHIGLKPE